VCAYSIYVMYVWHCSCCTSNMVVVAVRFVLICFGYARIVCVVVFAALLRVLGLVVVLDMVLIVVLTCNVITVTM